jgi:hypothetical protein
MPSCKPLPQIPVTDSSLPEALTVDIYFYAPARYGVSRPPSLWTLRFIDSRSGRVMGYWRDGYESRAAADQAFTALVAELLALEESEKNGPKVPLHRNR